MLNLKQLSFKSILFSILGFLYISILALMMLSARPFAGLYIFGYRLGELIMVSTFLLTLLFFIAPKRYTQNIFVKSEFILFHKIIIFCFLVVCLITDSSFTDTYTYRASTFIWTIVLIYLGAYFLNNDIFKKYYLLIFLPIPFINYLFSTGFYPNFIMDFYIKYSDKFQFIKASDLLLTYLVVNLLFIKLSSTKKYAIYYFAASSALYAPLLLFNSRGAFISEVIFILFLLYYFKSFFLKDKMQIVIVLLITLLFGVSSLLYIVNSFELIEVEPEPIVIVEASKSIVKNKNTVKAILGFYICENRLCSQDNTLDWRLDIWGDLAIDMNKKNIMLKGYGFNEIFPVMLDPTAPGRLGRDGLNENVHNYFVNIFGRMGLFGLISVLLYYLFIVKAYKHLNKNLSVLTLLIPVFFNSFFDANMEGVQYPLIFFSFLGFLYFENLIKQKT